MPEAGGRRRTEAAGRQGGRAIQSGGGRPNACARPRVRIRGTPREEPTVMMMVLERVCEHLHTRTKCPRAHCATQMIYFHRHTSTVSLVACECGGADADGWMADSSNHSLCVCVECGISVRATPNRIARAARGYGAKFHGEMAWVSAACVVLTRIMCVCSIYYQ